MTQTTLTRLAREGRPYYPRLLLAIALGGANSLLLLVGPAALGIIINRVIDPASHHRQPDLAALYIALGATYVALVLSNFATYGTNYITTWSGQRFLAKLRQELFERLLRLPLESFDRWRPGELIARFNSDLQVMSDAVSVSLPQLINATLTFVGSFGAMVWIDWLLTLVLVVIAPLMSFAVSRFQKLISTSMSRSQSRIANLSATLTEILQAQRIVKTFGREDFESGRFRHRNEDYFGAFMKVNQFIYMQPVVISSILSLGVITIIWLSVREVLVGRLNSGLLFSYWMLVVNLVNPMNRMAAFVGDLSKALVATGRAYELLDLSMEEETVAAPGPMPRITGRIDFDRVRFAYGEQEVPALDDVTASIDAGAIVALVGPSGAGKTTLVNMIPRFYLPQAGRVLIDGTDIAQVRLADLRSQIAIVPQDPQLFRASIAENIRYGRLDASDAEVRAAAIEANADEFIRLLPLGYQTEVGERGVRLSGGERQRIAIARAIVRDPRILILDEATSALDRHSEALIESALDRLLPGRTTLIIAHRLSTIRRATTILYIEGGRVVETGTHDALLARNGAYARLHAAQFSA
ncbi:MAG TPA: ABC transporter ATP-binding protein [Candidatus Acidoferrales bacterium]|nr:ABC transporter ATP-binding protein [Candidatus Acidoferrales bacterium]HTX56538.1 ABC transporter ATP-binding protein [Candidatus Acidoferrales bacterium]